MAITREKKEEIIKKVQDIVHTAGSVVFVRFHGLTVTDADDLRHTLKEQGVSYVVVKKTLARRVLENAGLEGAMPELYGELALAYSDEQVSTAKGIASFQKKLKDAVVPLGGILEMRYISADEVKSLSLIPSHEVLYGQLVTVVNAPIQNTVQVLHRTTQSFVSVLHQIAHAK